jgi:hypothetical protein
MRIYPHLCSRRQGRSDASSLEGGGDAHVAKAAQADRLVSQGEATKASLSPCGDEASPPPRSRFNCPDWDISRMVSSPRLLPCFNPDSELETTEHTEWHEMAGRNCMAVRAKSYPACRHPFGESFRVFRVFRGSSTPAVLSRQLVAPEFDEGGSLGDDGSAWAKADLSAVALAKADEEALTKKIRTPHSHPSPEGYGGQAALRTPSLPILPRPATR